VFEFVLETVLSRIKSVGDCIIIGLFRRLRRD